MAFRLLKSANLCTTQENLVRATINYKNMVEQLKKVVGHLNSEASCDIKQENDEIFPNETYYGGGKYRNRNQNIERYQKYEGNQKYEGRNYQHRNKSNFPPRREQCYEHNYEKIRKPRKLRGINPLHTYGKTRIKDTRYETLRSVPTLVI